MTLRVIVAGDVARLVDFGPEQAAASLLRVVWRARLVDERDQRPLDPPFAIATDSGLAPVSGPGGLVGLAEVPTRRYPELAAVPVVLAIRIEAPGYLPIALADILTATADHPASFAPAGPAQAVELQALPQALTGSVRRRGPAGLAPVAGATVRVAGIWQVMPSAGAPQPPPEPPAVVEVRPGFTDAFIVGTPVQSVALAPAGTATALRRFARRGALEIELAARAGLGPGTLLAIEPDHPDRAEFVRIAAVAAEPPAPLPGRVTLAAPLALDHRASSPVAERTTGGPGPQRLIGRAVIPGGVSLFVDDAVGLHATGFVEIVTGGPSPVHRVRPLAAVTDADGSYRLPPVHRLARVWIEAGDGVSSLPEPAVWEPGRGPEPARLDLELPP